MTPDSNLSIAIAVIGTIVGSGALWKILGLYRERDERSSKSISRLNALIIDKIEVSNRLSDLLDRKAVRANPNEQRQLEVRLGALELEEESLLNSLPKQSRKRYIGLKTKFVRPRPPTGLKYIPPGK